MKDAAGKVAVIVLEQKPCSMKILNDLKMWLDLEAHFLSAATAMVGAVLGCTWTSIDSDADTNHDPDIAKLEPSFIESSHVFILKGLNRPNLTQC